MDQSTANIEVSVKHRLREREGLLVMIKLLEHVQADGNLLSHFICVPDWSHYKLYVIAHHVVVWATLAAFPKSAGFLCARVITLLAY